MFGRVSLAVLVATAAAGPLVAQTLTFQSTDLPLPQPFYAMGAGDFDGDGFADLAVAHGNTLRMYSGPGPGPTWTSVTIPSSLVGSSNYQRTAAVADFDGDGDEDLALGYPLASITATFDGAVQIFVGPSLALGSLVLSPGPGANGFFGSEVASGDLNGDGIPDLFCSGVSVGPSATGAVFAFLGPNLTPGPVLNPVPGPMSFFGLISIGDLNGDSFADIVGLTANGLAAVPGPSLPATGAVFFSSIPFSGGFAVADFIPDGYADVVTVGSWALQVYPGPGLPELSIPFPVSPLLGAYWDPNAASCDLNGDGVSDLLTSIGASTYPANGAVVPFYPPYTAFTAAPELLLGFGWPLFGPFLATADFDADGFDDFATGALPNATWPPAASIARVFKARTLVPSGTTLSLGSGGTIAMTVRVSVTHAGRTYLILGSASGTYPGVAIGNLRIPIQPDPFTQSVLTQANGPLFPGFFGTLDANGEGSGSIVVPAGQFTDPALLGAALYFADVVLSAGSTGVQVSSNPVTITLMP